jgi:hypothetical protein
LAGQGVSSAGIDSAADQAFVRLAEFLADGRLTGVVASLEQALSGTGAQEAADAALGAGFEPALLEAALLIRRDVGRLNDLVHATAITLTLPIILKPGERMTGHRWRLVMTRLGRSTLKLIAGWRSSRSASGRAMAPTQYVCVPFSTTW